MANAWTVRAAALHELRRRYGVCADPETHPAWADLLVEVEDHLNETHFDEGGEA